VDVDDDIDRDLYLPLRVNTEFLSMQNSTDCFCPTGLSYISPSFLWPPPTDGLDDNFSLARLFLSSGPVRALSIQAWHFIGPPTPQNVAVAYVQQLHETVWNNRPLNLRR
jgi:hypothetical protein